METKALRLGRKILSVSVIAALLALTPGLGCYEALAAVIHSQAGTGQAPVAVPGQIGTLSNLSGSSLQLNLAAPGLSSSLTVLQKAPAVTPTQTLTAIPVLLAPALTGNVISKAGQDGALPGTAAPEQAPVTAQQVLENSAAKLAKAPTQGEKGAVLDSVYTGAKKTADVSADVSIPELSGSAAAATGLAPATPAPAQSIGDLQAKANDSSRPFAERVEAVRAIAAHSNDEAKAALKSIGQSNPEGNAVDYEVKRKALQSLAELGEVVSLPAISRAHADEILKNLSADKPQAAAFDYDGTLEANQVPASAETAAALKASVDAGVETMILTARSDSADDLNGDTILASLSPLTPEQKRGLVVGSNRGSRLSVFDKKGEAKLIYAGPVWSEAERNAINAAAAEVKARYGEVVSRDQKMTDYSFDLFLPVGTSPADVQVAAQMIRSHLEQAGVKAEVEGRTAVDPKNPSYLVVSKFGKDHGVGLLRQNRDYYGRLRDVIQILPSKLQGVGTKLVGWLPRSTVPEAKTLVVGDHLFGNRIEDLDMLKAAPNGMALAVGGTADPRAERVFVWPTQGHAATQEILGALGRHDSGGADKRSLMGIFTSRTASIAAFFLTSTAYAFIAIPAVGLASYGALMALGPLAAIAMGPLSGMLAKKLSARNAMALNTVLSVGLLLALPVMSAFGIINFWTLLVASIGNGYVLSSVMTTEGIYLKRFSGKYLGTINALTMIDYLAAQSLLGLILRAGRLTDYLQAAFPHLLAPYLIAAGVNVLVVLPLIWRYVSNTKAEAAPAGQAKPTQTWQQRKDAIKAFIKDNWLGALVFAGSLALFPVLHTTLPAVAGLLFWVSHSDGFKALWANKPLRYSLLAAGALAFLTYPFQSFILPQIAQTLAGAAGKSQLLGQLLGALFFGQLISSTSQVKLSDFHVPFLGRIKYQRAIQAGVLALLGTWTFMTLAPGSILLTLAAMAGGALMMALAGKLTDRGWIQYVGAGLAFLGLPIMMWGSVPALFVSALMMGMFLGPANNALGSYFYKHVPAGQSEKTIAVRGSLFNGAISSGYAVMSLLSSGLHLGLPTLLWPVYAACIVVGLGLLFLPKILPDLPKKALKDKNADQ